MTQKTHGGHRPGAGRKSCRSDKLAALYVADELAVTTTYARTLLRTGECDLTPAQWRTIALCIEAGLSDAETLSHLSGAA
ncbi:MAG: hypothetical protein WCQ16_06780 [Verrucomicrobiae bacterium]